MTKPKRKKEESGEVFMKDFSVSCIKHGKFLGCSICPICLREEHIEQIVCERTKYLTWEINKLREILKEIQTDDKIVIDKNKLLRLYDSNAHVEYGHSEEWCNGYAAAIDDVKGENNGKSKI